MTSPLYYVEIAGTWRSMRPSVWKDFSEAMAAHLQQKIESPVFKEYGKPVYGRPSRVRVSDGPGGKKVYWSDDKHLMIRTPIDWKLEDWKFAALEACRYCEVEDVSESPDIFSLILKE